MLLDRLVGEKLKVEAEAIAAEGWKWIDVAITFPYGHDHGLRQIVGATVVATHAGDVLAELTLCMTNGLGLGAIGATIHPYPTQGDAVRRCADAWRKTKLTPMVRSLFATWFRWFS